MIIKTTSISTRMVKSYAMKWGISFWVWWRVTGNWDNNIRISQSREIHGRTSISIRKKKQTQKSWTVWVILWDPSRKVIHLIKVIWARKIITEFTSFVSSNRIGYSVLMVDENCSKQIFSETVTFYISKSNLSLFEFIKKIILMKFEGDWYEF